MEDTCKLTQREDVMAVKNIYAETRIRKMEVQSSSKKNHDTPKKTGLFSRVSRVCLMSVLFVLVHYT